MAHAVLSPSSADRWTVCPGSVVLSADVEVPESKYAAEGTAAHELAARVLVEEKDPALLAGLDATEELLAAVRAYWEHVRALHHPGSSLRVEQPVTIAHVTDEPGAVGTVDALVLGRGELHVVDFKYGRGVRVSARTRQLQLYALGALAEAELLGETVEHVTCHIVQPRIDHVDAVVYSADDLQRLAAEINTAAKRVWEIALHVEQGQSLPETALVAGPHCRFCPAKAACPRVGAAPVVYEDAVAGMPDETRVRVAVAHAAPDVIARWLDALPLIDEWAKLVRQRGLELAAAGVLPGYKVVEGRRGARKWADEQTAVAFLTSNGVGEEEMYEMRLRTPAAVEKILKSRKAKIDLSPVVTQTEGSPTLVPVTDPRPALSSIEGLPQLEADEE